jgi:membrane associated rhomboid family serine protease
VPAFTAIVISMFLHGSILHIAGNMLYLWIFGNNVEDAMGHFRFLKSSSFPLFAPVRRGPWNR